MQLLQSSVALTTCHAEVLLVFEHDGIIAETAIVLHPQDGSFHFEKPQWGRVVPHGAAE